MWYRRGGIGLRSGCHYYCTLTSIQWLPHTDDQCATCSVHDTQAKGGGLPRRGNIEVGPQNLGLPHQQDQVHSFTKCALKMVSSNCPRDVPKLLPSQFLPPPPPMHAVNPIHTLHLQWDTGQSHRAWLWPHVLQQMLHLIISVWEPHLS